MGKPTKRERKFQASGGVKRRLERGGLAPKGKSRKRLKKTNNTNTSSDHNTDKSLNIILENQQQKSKANDFLSDNNIGDLDIDSFFEKLTDSVPNDNNDEKKEKQQIHSKNVANHDNSESSNDDDLMEEQQQQEHSMKMKNQHSKKSNPSSNDSLESSNSSDSDDDDDDDDLDAAEERMKMEMAKMKDADPEFHEFLQENEESLLQFGNDDDDDDALKDDDDDDDDDDTSGKKIHLTASVLASLEKGTFQAHGLKSLRKLVTAYKAACHLSDTAEDSKGGTSPYIIDSSKIFDKLMLLCLNKIHEEFHYHLLRSESNTTMKKQNDAEDNDESEEEADDNDNTTTTTTTNDEKTNEAELKEEEMELEDDKPIHPKLLEKAERWPQLRPIIQSFFKSTLHVMEEAKEPELLVFILKALSKLNRYLTPYPRLASTMLKSLVTLWSAPLDTSETYQVVRLNAFLRIRQLALIQPFPFIEDILKKTYLAYAKRAKFGTGSSVYSILPTLTFMGNCLCELYRLDTHSSYQHAFVYIRQLALLLRSAMHKKTKESMQQVYHWQYLHCLKLWVSILCDTTTTITITLNQQQEETPSVSSSSSSSLLMRSLIYPLTEVIMGTLRFLPSPARNLPYRFHCIRLLQQLAATTQTFIPTSAFLLEILDWKEWYLYPKKSMKKGIHPPQMEYILKLGTKDDALRTQEQLQSSMNAFFVLLNREIELYHYSVGFPEYVSRIMQRLRSFMKDIVQKSKTTITFQSRWRAMCKGCLDTCEKYSNEILQLRQTKLQESPKDIQQLECLLPISMKSMKERHYESVEKEQKLLDERMKDLQDEKQKKQQQNNKEEEDEDSDDDDDNDNDNEEKESDDFKKKKKKKNSKTTESSKQQQQQQSSSSRMKLMEEKEHNNNNINDDDDIVEEGVDWSDEE